MLKACLNNFKYYFNKAYVLILKDYFQIIFYYARNPLANL
jgi:hypothetical protein